MILNGLANQDPSSQVRVLFFYQESGNFDPATGFLYKFVTQLRQYPGTTNSKMVLQSILTSIENSAEPLSPNKLHHHLQDLFLALDASARLILIIDGWDDQLWILSALMHQLIESNALRDRPCRLRCMVSIRSPSLQDLPDRHCTLINLDKHAGVQRDIRCFARFQLASKLHDFSDDLNSFLDDLMRLISLRTDGMFLWAALVIEGLRSRTIAGMREELRSLPLTLQDIYQRMLTQIPTDQLEIARITFSWMLVARRPLTQEEIITVMAPSMDIVFSRPGIKPPSKEQDSQITSIDIVRACGGFVILALDQTLRFIHSTARDFLASRDPTAPLTDHLPKAHDMVTRVCIDRLLTQNSLNILSTCRGCQSRDSGKRKSTMEEYAMANWSFHYRMAESYGKTLGGLLQRSLSIGLQIASETMAVSQIHEGSSLAHSTLNLCIHLGANTLTQMHLESGLGCDYNQCEQCITPLMLAASIGSPQQIRLLLNDGFTTETAGQGGKTPLHFAIIRNDERIVKLLLSLGIKAHVSSNEVNQSLLCTAISSGNLEIMRLLLEASTDPKDIGSGIGLDRAVEKGQTCLHLAARSGATAIVKWLIENDEVCATSSTVYDSILRKNYFQSWSEEVFLNLSKGGNCVWELEERNAAERDLNNFLARPPRCADLDIRDQTGRTPLHMAAMNGHAEIVEYLLQRGASHNPQDCQSCTPLQLAAENGQLKIVKFLVARGATVEPSGESLGSMLERIYDYGHETIANLLMLDSYFIDVTGKGCSWRLLNVATKSVRSPIREALRKKWSKDRKIGRGPRTGLPMLSRRFSLQETGHDRTVQSEAC